MKPLVGHFYFTGPLCAPISAEARPDWWPDYWADDEVRVKYFNEDLSFKDQRVWHDGRIWEGDRIVVPANRVVEVISRYHDSPAAGHWGVLRTTSMLKRTYMFPRMKREVRAYVQTCDICQRVKADTHLPRGHLENLELPIRKWMTVNMDFVYLPPIPSDAEITFDLVLTVTDRATKMVHLIPCSTKNNAFDIAVLFMSYVVQYHGLPRSIVSDNGPVFVAKFWAELMKFMDVKMRRASPYHPQTNGLAERTNNTLKQLLRALLEATKGSMRWLDLLPLAEIAINSAPIANTEYSPFYLNYGYHPTFWWDLPQALEPVSNERTVAVRKHIKNMKEDWHTVRDAIDRQRRLATERANAKRLDYEFKVGQEVLINQRKYYKGRFGTDKNVLAPKAAGPFTIVRKN